ncbi:MAG: AI-2E family transporter [Acidimicrobiia bacterium]|nr:AI-2E family transporter [Acidimicrobiia bacterium]
MSTEQPSRWLDRAASKAWRIIVVLALVYAAFRALGVVKVVALPVVLALFPASVLAPIVGYLKRRGWSPILATWGSLLAIVPIVWLVVRLAVPSFVQGIEPLVESVTAGVRSLNEWLADGPLHLSEADLDGYIESAIESAKENAGTIGEQILGGAHTVFEIVTGVILGMLTTFFFLKDGDRAYAGVLARVRNPDRAQQGYEAAWRTLSSYVRGLALVGLIDAVFIGIGLAIVGAPLVFPIMILVFMGGFFPVIGAFLSGSVAVAVAAANGGLGDGLIVLAVVIGVQQFEGHILYPIVFRKALSLHPLVIILALAVGGLAFGIIGAFLAVPITAMAVAVHQATAKNPDTSIVALLTSRPYEEEPSEIVEKISHELDELEDRIEDRLDGGPDIDLR